MRRDLQNHAKRGQFVEIKERCDVSIDKISLETFEWDGSMKFHQRADLIWMTQVAAASLLLVFLFF